MTDDDAGGWVWDCAASLMLQQVFADVILVEDTIRPIDTSKTGDAR